MKIREVMTRDVRIASPDMSLRDAARMMKEADTGFLPVGEDDRLVGTITDRDITIRATAEGMDPNSAHVRDAMTRDLVYGFEDDEANAAAQIMGEKKIKRLPILNRDKRLVGVVSIGDLATVTGEDEIVGQAVEEISQPGGPHQQ